MIDQFGAFLLAITLLTLLPGVDSLLVLRNSARGGRRDGLLTSTGICCGLFIHALISALGISVLLLQSVAAFQILKLLGGGYLIWLGGINLWRGLHGCQLPIAHRDELKSRPVDGWRSLREGLICNLCNPKTLLFYMAFLPQFIDPQRAALPQALFMASVHFVIAMVYQGALAVLAERVAERFRGVRWRRCADSLMGGLLVSFGIRFLLEKRL